MHTLKTILPANASTVKQIGGKAFHLAELKKHNFLIPETMFIPVSAYREFTAHNNLDKKIVDLKKLLSAAQSIRDIKSPLKALREGFLQGTVPENCRQLFKEILQKFSQPLAVRSSGISEDQAAHSIAGQYSSVLHVEPTEAALIKAVKEVWASQWNITLAEYLLDRQISSFNDGMAVIVQRMLKPQFAGVLFTQNPNNLTANTLVLEYVRGVAEELVSGNATPQHIEFSRDAINLDTVPKLARPQFLKLVQQSLQIEKMHGVPVDIEWAIENERVYFLQYRPLTGAREEILWTNENVGEVIPDVVTPFSWSILKPVTNRAFENLLRVMNIKNFSTQGLFDTYKGKVYFNSTQFNRLLSGFYVGEQIRDKSALAILLFLVSRIPVFLKAGLFILTLGGKIERYLSSYAKKLGKVCLIENQTAGQHFTHCRSIIKTHHQTMFLHVSCTIFAELYYQLLNKICQRQSGQSGKIFADELLTGTAGAESAESGRALWRLAEDISQDGRLSRVFLKSEPQEIEKVMAGTAAGLQIINKIDQFIIQFGHGALHEFELFYPRWWEDRQYIYSNLKNYLKNLPGFDWQEEQEKQQTRQQLAYRKALKMYSFFSRFFFRYVLKKARFFSARRENLKQAFIKMHSELKKHLLTIENDFKLTSRQDILFLTMDEISDLVASKMEVTVAQTLIEKRKTERRQYLKTDHPQKVKQVGKHWIPVENEMDGATRPGFKGIACSAGIVEGPARIILEPETFSQMEKGDILITRATNPGWTPLFVLAAGLVTEIGGALSHGAIIAREYGLPMVAAIPDITKKINDGQYLRLNGFTGTVELINEAE